MQKPSLKWSYHLSNECNDSLHLHRRKIYILYLIALAIYSKSYHRHPKEGGLERENSVPFIKDVIVMSCCGND